MQIFAFAPQHDERKAIQVLKQRRENTPFSVRLDAVRALVDLGAAPNVLLEIAADHKNEPQLRAEAITGLSLQSEKLLPLLQDSDSAVQLETIRCLRPVASEPKVRSEIERLLQATKVDRVRRQLEFALGKNSSTSDNPKGDPESGRRLFFQPSLGCARCHCIEDFGGHIGPDLSVISRASDRKKLLESILEPSKEIAPQFVQHTVETRDGETWSGLLTSQSKDGSLTLTASDGRAIMIPAARVKSHTTSKISLMPEGLHQAMSPDDLQDLLAFLSTRK